MNAPEFPRPSVGDELILVHYKTRYQPRTETPVRVTAVARFRITVEVIDGERLSAEEWDLRTQCAWAPRASDRMISYNARTLKLHTAETLAYERRMDAVKAYLSENCLRFYEMRGTLGGAAKANPIGFVNALRRFEGLEEI